MKIGYWKGVIVKDNIEERCREALNLLSLREYASLHLEKLAVPGERIYSIRVNIEDRLIMTEHRGMLVVLEYVENHNYHKSQFLDKGGLKRYLRSQGANLDEAIAAGFQTLEDAAELARVADRLGDKPVSWHEVERHDARWIQLTDDQEAGLCAKLPMMVKGSAGSGKSTLALSMLFNDLQTHEAEQARVYLCKSSILRGEMYRRWCGMGLDEALWQGKVLFLTLEELLKEHFVGHEVSIVKPKLFTEWYKTHVKKNPMKGSFQEKNLEVNLIWEEVQKCAACKTVDEYYDLGLRQSSLEHDERDYVYKAYAAYIAYLKNTNQVSPELFVTDERPPLFSLLMIDEGQNLSPAEVALLLPLAINNNSVIFAGDQQVINSRCPNLPAIRSHFYKLRIAVSEITLPVTHRCPTRVVSLVNELTRFKRLIAGGRADKSEQDEMLACDGAIEGEVTWHTPETMDLDILQQRARHTDFAVVTRPEYKDQVKALFPEGVVVFTVDEAQGLDIPDLLVFNIFEEAICQKIVPLLESKEQKQHLAKAGQTDWSFNREFDSLITILTRTERTLTIVNEAPRYTTQVMAHLRHLSHPLEAKATAAAPRKLHAPSTDGEWVAKASAYLLSGHEEQALQIWINFLHRPKSDFAAFKDDLLSVAEKVKPVVLAEAIDSALSPLALNPQAVKPIAAPAVHLTKAEVYIHDLVVKYGFNHERVSCLLNHSNVIKYLFKTPYAGYDCLLKYVLSTPAYLAVFQQVLKKNPQQAGKVFSYADDKTLKLGIELFIDFNQMDLLAALANYPEFCLEMTGETLLVVFNKIHNPLALEILGQLLIHHPELCQGITAAVLCSTVLENTSVTPLNLLCSKPKGRAILNLMFEKKVGLRESIGNKTKSSSGDSCEKKMIAALEKSPQIQSAFDEIIRGLCTPIGKKIKGGSLEKMIVALEKCPQMREKIDEISQEARLIDSNQLTEADKSSRAMRLFSSTVSTLLNTDVAPGSLSIMPPP